MHWPSTQLTIRIILFYSRLYDCVRLGHVLSRRKALEKNKPEDGQMRLFIHKDIRQPPFARDWKHYRRAFAKKLHEWRDMCMLNHYPEQDPRTRHADITCPIPDMNRALRFYNNFTLLVQGPLMVNYTLISMAEAGWFDKQYVCMIPGRISFTHMAAEVPSVAVILGFLVTGLRMYTHFFLDSVDLDCYSFLMYTEEQVLQKERDVDVLNRIQSERDAHEAYIDNYLFYRRVHRLDGRVLYAIKPHRTINQWRKLKKYIDDRAKGQYVLLVIFMLFPAIAVYRSFSHEMFSANYSGCNRFALFANDTSGDFQWSFIEPYRAVMFVFDLSLSVTIGVDISLIALFVAMVDVIVTNDLDYRLSDTCDRIDRLNDMLVQKYCERAIYPHNHIYNNQAGRSDENIQNEILMAQNDIVDLFEQVGLCDFHHQVRRDPYILLVRRQHSISGSIDAGDQE